MFRNGLFVVLALCVALCCPTIARAAEVNYIDSFNNGIETLKGNDVSENENPEKDFIDNYEPVLLKTQTVAADEEPVSVLQKIRVFFNQGLAFTFDGYNLNLTNYLGILRLLRDIVVPAAVIFVFVWWGLRKSLRMLMSAFRKGKANV